MRSVSEDLGMAQSNRTGGEAALVNGNDDGELLDVLDLPQLYQRPSASTLLSILENLKLTPLSWDVPTSHSHSNSKQRKINEDGVPAYLTKIIASSLAWIDEEDQREQMWESASARLSERSGRSGMGALTRTFRIPLPSNATQGTTSIAEENDGVLEIQLHEPALTSDNLGLKTWASSYLLAKRLTSLASTLPTLQPGEQILELGAGTGLVGIAAATVFKAHVFMTDLPEIVENLERNCAANEALIEARGGSAEAAVLDWMRPEEMYTRAFEDGRVMRRQSHSFGMILAADPIYSSEHPQMFAETVEQHLRRAKDARLIIELPLRESYAPERQGLRSRLEGIGIHILDEGEETGYDDWSDPDTGSGLAEVRCWWSVWGWR